MYYLIKTGVTNEQFILKVLDVRETMKTGEWAAMEQEGAARGGKWITRHNLASMEMAEMLAHTLTTFYDESETPRLILPIDCGANVWPRYDVIEAPRMGDEVSYEFNGDAYPAGTIMKMSKSLKRVSTSEGHVFYRRGQSGAWIKGGGTWAMVKGRIYKQNPSF